MSRLLDKMLARTGKSRTDFRANSKLGTMFRKDGVGESEELHRVVSLPRRQWSEEEAAFLQEQLTDLLAVPGGEQVLRPLQAISLAEIHDHRGLLGILGVGKGKTLLTRLIPLVMEAKRPLLVVPGSLRDKTHYEFDQLDKHWRRHENLEVVSYSLIAHKKHRELLWDMRPDLIICDEAQELAHRTTATTTRMEHYLESNPETIFAALSGTITKRSLHEFHHLLRWTHGPETMPLPFSHDEMSEWALAIDEKVDWHRRMSPGALRVFVGDGTKDIDIDEARAALSARLVDTPGVLATQEQTVDASIRVRYWYPELPETLKEALETLRTTGELPSGDIAERPADVWRHARTLCCGVVDRWVPPPPDEWLTARRAWSRYVREQLEMREPGLDSPSVVKDAVRCGALWDGGRLEKWEAIEPTYTISSVPEWVDDDPLRQAAAEVEKIGRPTLVWVHSRAVGHRLSQITGWPYFGRGGLDASGRPIEQSPIENVIVSVPANSRGRNLQAWSSNFVLQPSESGAVMQQLMGRTHREGQEAHDVEFVFSIGDSAVYSGLRQAFRDAEYIQSVTGEPQKLLIADVIRTKPEAKARTKEKE